jgi:HAMP domain-containing protein
VRFYSPISYWDRAYYADIVAPLEHLLVLGIVLYFTQRWLQRRQARLAEEGV